MSAVERVLAQPIAIRRTLAVALLVFVNASAWFLVFAPLRWIVTSQQEWRVEATRELARLKGVAASEPATKKALAELPAAPAWARFYKVAPGTDGSALIHRDIAALCGELGATILSVTPLPSGDEQGLGKYGIRLSASMTADQLRNFIVRIRGRAEYVRTEALAISAPQMQSPEGNPILTVTLELFGYSKEQRS